MKVIYCLDFDGVLVDSATETGIAGLKAAKILFPHAKWLHDLETHPLKQEAILSRFREIRPCLDSGWEAALLIKLLADDQLPVVEILNTFQAKLKHQQLKKLDLTKEQCNGALKKARNDWIKLEEKDWLNSHDFYDGACQAVEAFLKSGKADDVYIITTKATEYAKRLLQKVNLLGEGKITESHIYGLGSGGKNDVIGDLLKERGEGWCAVMVEDNILTLEKIMHDDAIKKKVLPVVACWGYNTVDHQQQAKNALYVMLDENDPSSIQSVLEDSKVSALLESYQQQKQKRGSIC
jgi:hypothetical protein